MWSLLSNKKRNSTIKHTIKIKNNKVFYSSLIDLCKCVCYNWSHLSVRGLWVVALILRKFCNLFANMFVSRFVYVDLILNPMLYGVEAYNFLCENKFDNLLLL